jgi:hypothetical protein
MFEVRLNTTTLPPPRAVTIRTPLNDWADIEGTYADAAWVFQLDETELWTRPAYFKFVLDHRDWMQGSYIRIAPAAGASFSFDDSEVSFPMSTITSAATAAPGTAQATAIAPVPALPALLQTPVTERAILNRVVVLATPFLTAFVAWLAGVVGRHVPGVTFDQTQLVSFMIAIVTVCLALAWKWLQGWQQHELLVAQGLAAPIKTKPTL